MLQRRSGSACAVLGNQLVLLGGNDGTQASICTNFGWISDGKDVQRFDFSEDFKEKNYRTRSLGCGKLRKDRVDWRNGLGIFADTQIL